MRVLGHPLHPPLAHVPLATWLLTPLADAAAFATGDAFFVRAATWLTGVGLAGALAAAAAGLADLGSTRLDKPTVRVVERHAMVMASAIMLAVFGLLGRIDAGSAARDPPAWPAAVGAATAMLALVGAWFGGELVYSRGVGRREP